MPAQPAITSWCRPEKDVFGYEYIQPVHQGRAAEKVLFPLLLGKGKVAISNMFFDTTRAHVELAGARAIDCVTPQAKLPSVRAPFKGQYGCSEAGKADFWNTAPNKLALW